MNNRNSVRLSKLTIALVVALAAAPAFAQNTSSGLDGEIYNAGGQPVAGADVTIVHTPSGTISHVTTDAKGRYSATGLRVGGPYKVTITKDGQSETQDNVYLQLAEIKTVDVELGAASAENATNLSAVQVKGKRVAAVFNPDNKGLSTDISSREIEAMPTPGRSIQDVVRTDPRITISNRDRGEISANGQNSRYNNISIDSVGANDPFGLNANGLPILGTPISQDTIEAYHISTANYDVTNRRGVGADINAVTKSGTNDFHGSVYYAFQNTSSMVGKLPNGSGIDAKYGGFSSQNTGGFTLGGPIIKDKLFFFASYEKSVKKDTGAGFGPVDSDAGSTVNGLTQAEVDAITAAAIAKGFTPGDYSASGVNLVDKRTLVKLDWNISDYHRASFRYTRTQETQPVTQGTPTTLVLDSGWYLNNTDNKSYALNLYDDWSDNFSTEASVSYSSFSKMAGPLDGIPQPDVTVHPTKYNDPGVEFGTNYSYQANQLAVNTHKAFLAGTWKLGSHTLKGGMDFQSDSYYDLFLQDFYGSYTFDTLDLFNKGWYYQYYLKTPAAGYSLNDVAADFSVQQYGFFLQDSWQATRNLSLQFGVRVDTPYTNDKPIYNPCFAAPSGQTFSTSQCADIASSNPNAAIGGFGFSNSTTIDGNRVIQPRMSFNYQFDTERPTQLRGGLGLFITNPPSVWLANPYQNNGITVASYSIRGNDLPPNGTSIPDFSSDPFNQNTPVAGPATPGKSGAQMAVDTVDKDFKLPTVGKGTLAFDHELPWWNVVFSAEYERIKVKDGIYYQNLNIGTPTGVLPDGRLSFYKNPNGNPQGNTNRYNANPSFGTVTYLSNTDKGGSDTFTLSLKKPFSENWFGTVGYTWSRATEVNGGNSSVANSNYKYTAWVNPNQNQAVISQYSIPNRIIASLNWRHHFFGDYATSVGAFYDGHSGSPFSWVFGNDANGDSYATDLVYIPKPGDIEFAPGTTAQQQQQFFDFIKSDKYLNQHQGQIADTNGARASWLNQIDLSFQQEVPGFLKGNKGIVRLDIFNFTNLLNKHWGVEHRGNFSTAGGGRALADSAGVDPVTGKYIYNISGASYKDANGNYHPLDLPINEFNNPSQRWSLLLTLKYTF